MTSFRPTFVALLASFLFTACNSGGGSDAIIPPSVLPPPPLSADLQTTVPEPASTDLKELNTLRGQLGLGLLAEENHLVIASTKHVGYSMSHVIPAPSHSDGGINFWTTEEDSADFSFSGGTANERCLTAGYSGDCNDVFTIGGSATFPDRGLYDLLAKSYGGIMLFTQQPRHAGVALKEAWEVGGMFRHWLFISWHFGTPTSGGQRQGSGFVLTYPLPDSSVPNLSFGHAINLHINAGETLTVDSFTLLDKNGSTVATTLLTQATDPEKFVPGHVAVLVPNAPLVAGMDYIANFWGKRNGTGFSRTWNFSVSNIP